MSNERETDRAGAVVVKRPNFLMFACFAIGFACNIGKVHYGSDLFSVFFSYHALMPLSV